MLKITADPLPRSDASALRIPLNGTDSEQSDFHFSVFNDSKYSYSC